MRVNFRNFHTVVHKDTIFEISSIFAKLNSYEFLTKFMLLKSTWHAIYVATWIACQVDYSLLDWVNLTYIFWWSFWVVDSFWEIWSTSLYKQTNTFGGLLIAHFWKEFMALSLSLALLFWCRPLRLSSERPRWSHRFHETYGTNLLIGICVF